MVSNQQPSTVWVTRIFNSAIDEWWLYRENPVKEVIRSLPQENKRLRYVLPAEAEGAGINRHRIGVPKTASC
jgi:hypothetical protein